MQMVHIWPGSYRDVCAYVVFSKTFFQHPRKDTTGRQDYVCVISCFLHRPPRARRADQHPAVNHILFRCDASFHIGSGHVVRCRTLARELRRRGAEITFLCRRQPGDLIKLLEQEFQVLSLPEQQLASFEELEGRALYGAWLGCSQQQDAADCLAALEQAGINSAQWLVVDHYSLDASWEGAMREIGRASCRERV